MLDTRYPLGPADADPGSRESSDVGQQPAAADAAGPAQGQDTRPASRTVAASRGTANAPAKAGTTASSPASGTASRADNPSEPSRDQSPAAADTAANHAGTDGDATGLHATTADAASTQIPAGPGPAATRTGTLVPSQPATGHAVGQPPGVAGSLGGMVFALLLVLALILVMGWLAKRLPGARAAAGGGALRVVASVALGPRERAMVVDVGGTQLLLGVGPGGTRTLHVLDTPLPATPSPQPFAQVLARQLGQFGRKP